MYCTVSCRNSRLSLCSIVELFRRTTSGYNIQYSYIPSTNNQYITLLSNHLSVQYSTQIQPATRLPFYLFCAQDDVFGLCVSV